MSTLFHFIISFKLTYRFKQSIKDPERGRQHHLIIDGSVNVLNSVCSLFLTPFPKGQKPDHVAHYVHRSQAD